MTKVVGLSGSPSASSRTRAVVEGTVDRILSEVQGLRKSVDLSDLTMHLGIASRDRAHPIVEAALKAIEDADLLIAGSPVYKGSYTGLFKHLIDLVDYRALAGKTVGLIATGGSDRHALVIEHQLRPLFSFFGAQTLATGVFVLDKAVAGGQVQDEAARSRLDQLVSEAIRALRSR